MILQDKTELIEKYIEKCDTQGFPEPLKITGEQAREIIYDDSDKFSVVKIEITSNSRWSIYKMALIVEQETGNLYTVGYSVGATEYQEERRFEYEEEVTLEPAKFKLKTVYEC